MSLKKFHIIFVLAALAGIVLLSYSIDHLLQKNIDINVENSIQNESIVINERLKNNYAVIEQKFSRHKKSNLRKLQEVSDYVAAHPDKKELSAIAAAINAYVIDGYYEIYVINDEKVIEKSTRAADIGFDFKQHPLYVQILDRLKAGIQAYEISATSIENQAMNLEQYYFVRGKGNYWVEIGYVLPLADFVKNNLASLYKVYPSLSKLDVYILTPEYVQHINEEERQDGASSSMVVNGNRSTTTIMKDLGLEKDPLSSDFKTITTALQKQSIVFLPKNKKMQTIYSLIKNDLGNSAGDFQLIAKMEFNTDYHRSEYFQLKNLLHIFIIFVFVFALLSFTLMYYAVIRKITDITVQMKKDEPIMLTGHLFREFNFLILRYNTFLLQWKEEVKRLNEITMLDELTKSYNRRYFNQKVQKHIDLFRRYGQEFSMIMFDIDDFKKINDAHGHDVGDQILRSIVNDVLKQIRSSDILCRIGG
ncbi:MAG: GGDEF domain-containing protein, partial [Thiovulaceae bacterium]|nr:GGDEF domain-containing protein [Sulfurimonadaceae bacterium]